MNFKIQIDSLKKKVENCLDMQFSGPHCFGFIEIIHDELKSISFFVKSNAGLDNFCLINNEYLIKDLIHLTELVYKLCETFTSQNITIANEIIKTLKIIFKFNFDLEMTALKIIEDMKPNIFNENINLITELSLALSSCAVVAERLEMKAGLPLWRTLKTLTSSYCGTFMRTATNEFYSKLLNNFRQSFWFRFNSWQSNSQKDNSHSEEHLIKELKMSSFLMKCFLTFISTYEAALIENQQIVTEILRLAFEIIDRKLELVISNQNACQLNQSFDDSILYGCEIIASLLLKHYQVNDIITEVQEFSNGRFVIEMMFFGYLMKTVTSRNEPEQSSAYILELCHAVIEDLLRIRLSSDDDYGKFNYVYKQVYVQTSCLICIHCSPEIIQLESYLWDSLFQCNVLHAWIYLADIIVFLSRYGPITILSHYCDFLSTLIPQLVHNNFPINFILMIGNLFSRFLGFKSSNLPKEQLSNKNHPISVQYFCEWTLSDDINDVVNSSSNVIMEFLSTLKGCEVIKLCTIYQVVFSILILEKLKELGHNLLGVKTNVLMIKECIGMISNNENVQDIKHVTTILDRIINKYPSNQKLPTKRLSPMNEENPIIKKQKLVIDELEATSKKLCLLAENGNLILDNVNLSKLRDIVSTINNLL